MPRSGIAGSYGDLFLVFKGISVPSSRMAAIQKSTNNKLLERVWWKGNPLTLLVGMQTSTATMENSVEIP